MTDSADQRAYRHPVVYRTVRGLALSGGRQAGGAFRGALQAPTRIAGLVRAQRAVDPDLPDADGGADAARATTADAASAYDDAAGLYELRRYSEPND